MTDRVRSLEGFYVDEACQCAHAYWLHHTPTPFVRPFVHTCTRDACKMQSLDFTVYELDSRLRDHELPEGAGALCLRSLTPRGLLNVSADEQAAMRELVERVQTKRGAATCTPEETLAMETHAMKLYAAPPLFHVCVRGACPGPDYWPSLHQWSIELY